MLSFIPAYILIQVRGPPCHLKANVLLMPVRPHEFEHVALSALGQTDSGPDAGLKGEGLTCWTCFWFFSLWWRPPEEQVYGLVKDCRHKTQTGLC